jgi:hypothetical protein
MKLQNILTPTEMVDFNRLEKQAHKDGAGSVRFHIPKRGLVVIGILGNAQLLTWFLAAAKTESEAILTETTVLAGIHSVSQAYTMQLTSMATEASDLATEAIQKAAQCKT